MLLTPILIVALAFNIISGAKRKPPMIEIKPELTGNDTLQDLMNMVDKHELRIETVKLIQDKFGEKLFTSLKEYQTPKYYEDSLRTLKSSSDEDFEFDLSFQTDFSLQYDSNLQSDSNLNPDLMKLNETRRKESLPDWDAKSKHFTYAYLADSADKQTKDNIIRLMKHIIYAAQDEIGLLTPIVQKYSKFLRFRLAYTFRMLEEIGYELRMMYLRMKNKESPYGNLTITSHVIYYTQAFRKYTDIIYISEQITRWYNNYRAEKEGQLETYKFWLEMNPLWKMTLPSPPP